MTKKQETIVQELDIKEVEGFSEAQISYYLSLGFKPYACRGGKVKWLMPEQQSLRIASRRRRTWIERLFLVKPDTPRPRKRHRANFIKFIRYHWLFLLIIALLAMALAYIIKYPQILI